MSNRLAQETSPYLLQHQENPVDWFPWGEEALEKARREEKPIFLSIGYSACHWCHVMEHESFEDASIAATLNEHFVPIKVDREERPDLDHIYMTAVQMLTGRGGWPMSVFLTPDLKPFYGGTYWPPRAGRGMPGFDEILEAVRAAWHDRREQALAGAEQLTEQLQQMAAPRLSPGDISPQLLHAAAAKLEQAFDFTHGGFGGAPKFPHPMDLGVLLRFWSREPREGVLQMVQLTLDRMAHGGIYDHLGGGFARYSVDARWLVPHFEKMLYDNALAGAYLEGYQATGDAEYARVVRETLDYLLRDMTDAAGGLYSTEDADSEGVEGKFYVWSPDEIEGVLGVAQAETFCYVYDVSEEGNFEGQSILNLPKTIAQCAQIRGRDEGELAAELAESRAALLEVRNRRVRPGRDDKVLVSWNGLAIDALARAGGALEEPRYLQAARRAADFILAELRRPDGRLLHTWRDGQAKFDAYLDDYACLANGLVSLYEATFDERYLTEAVGLADQMLAHFQDAGGAGFFYTADDHETLIARTRDLQDSSVPSGSGMAATLLVRLAKLTGNRAYGAAAEETLAAAVALMQQSPTAAGQLLLALDFHVGPTRQIAIVGDPESPDTRDVVAGLRRRFLPRQIVALRPPGMESDSSGETSSPLATLFAGREGAGDGPTAYVCEEFTCQAPLAGKRAILDAWQRLGQP